MKGYCYFSILFLFLCAKSESYSIIFEYEIICFYILKLNTLGRYISFLVKLNVNHQTFFPPIL